ncbi:MAG TPA: hypothetical protein VM925_33980 [Labilithrix sp.]|nr:hypothetical protein [Labilithrix sp.]
MRHLPSIEALTAGDDSRLLAELEICEVQEKLAKVRALVDRADHLLATVLACGEQATDADVADIEQEGQLAAAILASLRRGSTA